VELAGCEALASSDSCRRKMHATRGMLWACTLAVLIWAASGAAIIENQTSAWASAGLGEYFARATDNILPLELAQMVMEEVLLFERHEREERAKNVEGGSVSF